LPLKRASSGIEDVTIVDLYAEYPDFCIDIDREQQRLREHDIIVFMFPLYWYSTPSILKEWQDLVLEHGFAYGHDGKELSGKKLLCALTAGGNEDETKGAKTGKGSDNQSELDALRQQLKDMQKTIDTIAGKE